jgi:hypothetical protein
VNIIKDDNRVWLIRECGIAFASVLSRMIVFLAMDRSCVSVIKDDSCFVRWIALASVLSRMIIVVLLV